MSFEAHKNAGYKVTKTSAGNKYSFYCELSGALVCTTPPYSEKQPEYELQRAWLEIGKPNFNLCHKCGKWVCDVMYNADVLMCVDCAPWEDSPEFCPHCGQKTDNKSLYCNRCGKKMMYGGDEN